MAFDNIPDVGAQFAQGEIAPVRRGSSVTYYREVDKLTTDLKAVPALDMGITGDKSSPVIRFMQLTLNTVNKNKAAGEDGIASPAFMQRLNIYIKDRLQDQSPVNKPEDISGSLFGALISSQKGGFTGSRDGILGYQQDSVNRLLSEALRSIDNDAIKTWGQRFDPYPSKPVSQIILGTDGRLSYNALDNVLTAAPKFG
jgi:hypothetical protein